MPKFRGANQELLRDRSHECILSGPAETGKTFAALWRVDWLARNFPKCQGAIVRKVRLDMLATVLEAFKRQIIVPSGDIKVQGGEKPEFYDYPNGARIWVAGIDRPGKVLSGQLDFVYVNQAEELDVPDWETLTTRTTGRAGVIVPGLLFGDCNPSQSTHWILSRPSLKLLYSKHEDNPILFDDAGNITAQGKLSLSILDALTGVRYQRLRLGKWVSAEGAVYDTYDRSVHLIDRFDIPAEWRRIRVIDFGYTNPFFCGWIAIDPDGRMFLYREIYMTQRTVRKHAEQINALSVGENIEATVSDHDAEDRSTLEEAGIYTFAAVKAISPGIQAVQEALKVAGDARARFFIFRDSLVERDESLAALHKPVCTADEMEVYMWPKGADGRAIKEKPLDMNNHGCDGIRYGAMYAKNPQSLFAWS